MKVKPIVLIIRNTVSRYRFAGIMPSCISVYRYATLIAVVNWRKNVKRLRVAKGWTQGELADAIGMRGNTLSAALSEKPHEIIKKVKDSKGQITKIPTGVFKLTEPGVDTIEAIARGLDVPMWALFCTEEEYGVFSQQLRLAEGQQTDAARIAEFRAVIRGELSGIEEALVGKHVTGQPVAPAAHPLPTLAHSAPPAKAKRAR